MFALLLSIFFFFLFSIVWLKPESSSWQSYSGSVKTNCINCTTCSKDDISMAR